MREETAILAGGCYWGAQELIRRQPGVVSTRVGWSGGETPNPADDKHGDHAEAVEIIYDTDTISYRDLLEFFFQIHDPTMLNRQGSEEGDTSVRPSSIPAKNREVRPSTPSPMSMHPACGPERSLRRWSQRDHSGRLRRTTRIISRNIPMARRATSFVPAGSSRAVHLGLPRRGFRLA